MIELPQLLAWNRRGLVQGTQESNEAFIQRALAADKVSSSPSQEMIELFDLDPDWIEVSYSNEGLHFWEGGCTWIDKDKAALQLRKAYLKRKTYFGYTKEELLGHEMVHVVRGQFEEPIFEELLAYKTSPSAFRRYFGPMFRTPKESLGFVLVLACCSFLIFFSLWAYLGIGILIGLLLFRLVKIQSMFRHCCSQVAKLVTEERVLPVMVRLNDQEIIYFANATTEQIHFYAQEKAKTNLRWQQIIHSYF